MLASIAVTSQQRRRRRKRQIKGVTGLIGKEHIYNSMKKKPEERSDFELAYITKYVESAFPKFFNSISPSEDVKEKQKRNSTYLKSKKQVITLQIHF